MKILAYLELIDVTQNQQFWDLYVHNCELAENSKEVGLDVEATVDF